MGWSRGMVGYGKREDRGERRGEYNGMEWSRAG